MKNYILEVCVDSVESACIAEEAGANRIELCSNLIIGGTTPDPALLEEVKKRISIPIHALIRPRFGDFLYTEAEFSVIRREIQLLKQAGADGIVIGILNPDGTLDKERMKALMELAENMSVTLHRAFDMSQDAFETLEDAIHLGIHTILTSGQQANCIAGKEQLAKLVKQAAGRIDILVGSGVCAGAIKEIYADAKATSYHMSGKTVLNSQMTFRRADVPMGLPGISEYEIWRTDSEKVRKAKELLEALA